LGFLVENNSKEERDNMISEVATLIKDKKPHTLHGKT
jgi:hypothetical protein